MRGTAIRPLGRRTLRDRIAGRVRMPLPARRELLERTLVADPTTQIALVGRVEPDRDHDCPTRRRGLHELRVLERSSVTPVCDRSESRGVCSSFGGNASPLPAANLGVELLAVTRR